MELDPGRLVIELDRVGEPPLREPLRERTALTLGPVEISVHVSARHIQWSLTNLARTSIQIGSISLEFQLSAGESAHLFSNGYQSWSRCGVVNIGEDSDPSSHPDSIILARETLQSDPRPSAPKAVRSDLVTVIDSGLGESLLSVGFRGGALHDGVFEASRDGKNIALKASAYLGGIRLEPDQNRELHGLSWSLGDDASSLLEGWASVVGESFEARTEADYRVGWCSWYHYFHDVNEVAIQSNIARSGDFPFEVFQIDDGFQTSVGDWLITNSNFESSLEELAGAISDHGMTPGLWMAPFMASPDSEIFREQPNLFASQLGGASPLISGFNPGWGGIVFGLDTTRPETLDHLSRLAADLVDRGFRYLKLDFTYGPSIAGRYLDASQTPAQRVRAGLQAIRQGAGEETFLLGCGCPIGPGVGILDAMRVGPDVAPWWGPEGNTFIPPGFEEEAPATLNAWRNTLARSFMHRKLWINDPDCLMLRSRSTSLSDEASRAWALAVAASGGMAIVSDDLSLIDRRGKRLLDKVVEIGNMVDRVSRKARPPRCEDLMLNHTPTILSSEVARFVGRPEEARGELFRSSELK